MNKLSLSLFVCAVVLTVAAACKKEHVATESVNNADERANVLPALVDMIVILPPSEHKYLKFFHVPDGIRQIDDEDLRNDILRYMYYEVTYNRETLYERFFSENFKRKLRDLEIRPIMNAKQYAEFPFESLAHRYEPVHGYEKISDGEAYIDTTFLFQYEGHWYHNRVKMVFIREPDGWKYDRLLDKPGWATQIDDIEITEVLSKESWEKGGFIRQENLKREEEASKDTAFE